MFRILNNKFHWFIQKLFIIFFTTLNFTSTGFGASQKQLNPQPINPLNIHASQSEYDYKTGKIIFEGQVSMQQDQMKLLADKVITQSNDHHQIQSVFAFGKKNLAHYTQLNQDKSPPLIASARIIRYFPNTRFIILEKEAQVTQGKNHFSGDIIHYNLAEHTIMIPPESKGSALLIYHPQKSIKTHE